MNLKSTFTIVAIGFVLVGLLLFVFADSLATLPADARAGNAWPWPIGPLALRFVASLVLSGGVVSYLVSQRPDYTTLAAFFTVTSLLSGMLLLHFFSNVGSVDWGKPMAYVWLGALVIGFFGSLLLTARARRKAVFSVPPLPKTPALARNIAYFIAVLTGLVGVTMFFAPGFSRDKWPWDLANSTNVQLLGAVFLSVGLSSLLSALQPSWYGYDVFYPAAGTFAAAALIASFMHWNLFAAHPITSVVFVVVYLVGAIEGFYPFFRYRVGRVGVVGS